MIIYRYTLRTSISKENSLERQLERYSLAIEEGVNGARLSHPHSRQYTFVLQSMTLWREVPE